MCIPVLHMHTTQALLAVSLLRRISAAAFQNGDEETLIWFS